MIISGMNGVQHYKPHLVFRNGEWHAWWLSLNRMCWADFGIRGHTAIEAYQNLVRGYSADSDTVFLKSDSSAKGSEVRVSPNVFAGCEI